MDFDKVIEVYRILFFFQISPAMTIAVDFGCKATKQKKKQQTKPKKQHNEQNYLKIPTLETV